MFSALHRSARLPVHSGRVLRSAVLACSLAAASASWAQGTVLIQGPHAQVTTADAQAQLSVLPPERQLQILQSPDSLRSMVENIYQRRATAARAEQQNLHEQPAVRLKLEQAREGILAEAYLAERDKANMQAAYREQVHHAGAAKQFTVLRLQQTPLPKKHRGQHGTNLRHGVRTGDKRCG